MKFLCSSPRTLPSSKAVGSFFIPYWTNELVFNIVQAFDSQPRFPLHRLPEIIGCGVYGIYYTGNAPLYRDWLEIERQRLQTDEVPIYIGKAEAKGKRIGTWKPFEPTTGKELYTRISEHIRSIKAARNLRIKDFECKVLIAQPIWVQPAETVLISRYQPLWNTVIEGFGLHCPGVTRLKQTLSAWDSLHPGRVWSNTMKKKRDLEVIIQRVRNEMAARRKLIQLDESETH